MAEQYQYPDNLLTICRKILENLYGIVSGSLSISFTPGAGSAPTAAATATIAVTGTAVIAIPAGQKGYLSAAQGNSSNNIFVGGSGVTNSGANRGLELSPLGLTPLLTGPVYINGAAGDLVGVITV